MCCNALGRFCMETSVDHPDEGVDELAVVAETKDLGPYAQAWVRFVHSRLCLCIYVVLMVFNLCVLILELVGTTLFDRIFVMVCEGFINLFLAVEVVVDLIIFRLAYFKKWYHIIDFLLTVLCWVFYLMYIEEERPGKGGLMDLSVDSVLLGFRYAFQALRFCFVFLHSHRKKRIVSVEDIEFPPAGADPAHRTEEQDSAHRTEEQDSAHANLFSRAYAMKLVSDFFTAHTSTTNNNVPEQKDP